MTWTKLWFCLFGTDTFCGLNLGFWIALAAVILLVAAMNAVFWAMKPNYILQKGKKEPKSKPDARD